MNETDSLPTNDASSLMEKGVWDYFQRRFSIFLPKEKQEIPIAEALELLTKIVTKSEGFDPAQLNSQSLEKLASATGLTRSYFGFAAYLVALLHIQKRMPFGEPLTFEMIEASALEGKDALVLLAKKYFYQFREDEKVWDREYLLGQFLTLIFYSYTGQPIPYHMQSPERVEHIKRSGIHDQELSEQLQKSGFLTPEGDINPLPEWLPLAERIVNGQETQTTLPEELGALYSLLYWVAQQSNTVEQAKVGFEWAADNVPLKQIQFLGNRLMTRMKERNLHGLLAVQLRKSLKVRKLLTDYQNFLESKGGLART